MILKSQVSLLTEKAALPRAKQTAAMAARLLRVTRLRGLGNAPTVDYGAALRLQEALRTQRLGGADG